MSICRNAKIENCSPPQNGTIISWSFVFSCGAWYVCLVAIFLRIQWILLCAHPNGTFCLRFIWIVCRRKQGITVTWMVLAGSWWLPNANVGIVEIVYSNLLDSPASCAGSQLKLKEAFLLFDCLVLSVHCAWSRRKFHNSVYVSSRRSFESDPSKSSEIFMTANGTSDAKLTALRMGTICDKCPLNTRAVRFMNSHCRWLRSKSNAKSHLKQNTRNEINPQKTDCCEWLSKTQNVFDRQIQT